MTRDNQTLNFFSQPIVTPCEKLRNCRFFSKKSEYFSSVSVSLSNSFGGGHGQSSDEMVFSEPLSQCSSVYCCLAWGYERLVWSKLETEFTIFELPP